MQCNVTLKTAPFDKITFIFSGKNEWFTPIGNSFVTFDNMHQSLLLKGIILYYIVDYLRKRCPSFQSPNLYSIYCSPIQFDNEHHSLTIAKKIDNNLKKHRFPLFFLFHLLYFTNNSSSCLSYISTYIEDIYLERLIRPREDKNCFLNCLY